MIELDVPGITCDQCATTIRRAVAGVDPGASCEVDVDARRVNLQSAMPPSDFVEALEGAGYACTLVRAIG